MMTFRQQPAKQIVTKLPFDFFPAEPGAGLAAGVGGADGTEAGAGAESSTGESLRAVGNIRMF